MDSLDTCEAYKGALSLYERYITQKLTMVTNYCLSSSRMSRAYILRAFTPDQLLYLGLGRSASTGDRVFSVLLALVLFESPHIDHTLDPSDVPTWLMMVFKASRSDLDSIIQGLKKLQHGFVKLPEYLIEAFENVDPSDVPNYEPPKYMVLDDAILNSRSFIAVKKYFMEFSEQCIIETLRFAVSNSICSQKIILRKLRPIIMCFLMYLIGLSKELAKLCLLPIGIIREIKEILSEDEIFEARDIAMFVFTYLHSADDLIRSLDSFHSRLSEEIGEFPKYFEDVLRILKELKESNQEELEVVSTSTDRIVTGIGKNSLLPSDEPIKKADINITEADKEVSAVIENPPIPTNKKRNKLRISANALAKVLEKYTRDGNDKKKKITIPADEVQKLLKKFSVSPQENLQANSEKCEVGQSLQTYSTPLSKSTPKPQLAESGGLASPPSEQVDSSLYPVSPDLPSTTSDENYKSTDWQIKQPRVILHRLDLETYEKSKISTVESLPLSQGSEPVPGPSDDQKRSRRSRPGPRSQPQRKPIMQPLLLKDKDTPDNNYVSEHSVSLLQTKLLLNSSQESAKKNTNDSWSLLLEPVSEPPNVRRCSPRRSRPMPSMKNCCVTSPSTHQVISEFQKTQSMSCTSDMSQYSLTNKYSEFKNLNVKTTEEIMPLVQVPVAVPSPLNIQQKSPRKNILGPRSKTQPLTKPVTPPVLSNNMDSPTINNSNDSSPLLDSRLELSSSVKEVKKTSEETMPLVQVPVAVPSALNFQQKSPRKNILGPRSKTQPLSKPVTPPVLLNNMDSTTINNCNDSSPLLDSRLELSSSVKEVRKVTTEGLSHSQVEPAPGPSKIRQITPQKSRIGLRSKKILSPQKHDTPAQLPINDSSGTNCFNGHFDSILESRLTLTSPRESVRKVMAVNSPEPQLSEHDPSSTNLLKRSPQMSISELNSNTQLSPSSLQSDINLILNSSNEREKKDSSEQTLKLPDKVSHTAEDVEKPVESANLIQCSAGEEALSSIPLKTTSNSSSISLLERAVESSLGGKDSPQSINPSKRGRPVTSVTNLTDEKSTESSQKYAPHRTPVVKFVPPKTRLKNVKIPVGKKLKFTEDKKTSNEPRSKLHGTDLPPKKAYLSSVSFNKTHSSDNVAAEDSQNSLKTLTPVKEGCETSCHSASRPTSPCNSDMNSPLSVNQSEEGTFQKPELIDINDRGLSLNMKNQSLEENCDQRVEPLQSAAVIKQPGDQSLEQVNSADSEQPKKNSEEAVLMLTSNGQLMTTEGEVLPFVVDGSYTVINEGAEQVIFYSLEGMESAPEAERVADSIDIYESEVESVPLVSSICLPVQEAPSSESGAAEPVYQYVPVGQEPHISIIEDACNRDSPASLQDSQQVSEILDDVVGTPVANLKRLAVNNPSYVQAKKLKTQELAVKKDESKEKQVRYRGRISKETKELEPWACGHLERRILANQRLILACREGDFSAVKMWLSNGGASVNTVDRTNMMQPLHWFAQLGNVIAVCFLLDRGAFLEAKGPFSMTALHLAVSKGHFEVVRALVERGANLEAIDDFGETPLHLAAYRGHSNLARFLLVKGANVYHLDKDGRDCIISAKSKGHIETVNLILEYLSLKNHK